MEKQEALDAVRNSAVHCGAITAALQGDHFDHAIGQLMTARERLGEALQYASDRKAAQAESSH